MHDLVARQELIPGACSAIPIGIDLEHFPLVDAQRREAARHTLGLPVDAFVVGSFQKDGIGWGDGLEPKLIKGPTCSSPRSRRFAPPYPGSSFF